VKRQPPPDPLAIEAWQTWGLVSVAGYLASLRLRTEARSTVYLTDTTKTTVDRADLMRRVQAHLDGETRAGGVPW